MKNILVVGSLNMDFVIEVEKRPQNGETVLGRNLSLIPGGKGANQAYTLGRLGAKTAMIGAVGDDVFGSQLIANLKTVGVDTTGVSRMPEVDTGKAFITVDQSGQNSIIVMPGANLNLKEEELLANEKLFEAAEAVVMQLEVPVETICAAAKLAKQKGKFVILDPAPAQQDLPEELFKLIDILKPNETELEILSGLPADTEENIIAAARKLIDKGVQVVIVTLGQKGAMLVQKDSWRFFPAQKVKAIDTTAAGDCFTAAFTCIFEKENYAEAIEFASKAAAIAVTRKGAQSSVPSMEEIRNS